MRKRLLRQAFVLAGLLAWPLTSVSAQSLFCPSLGAYYPYVTSCPTPWVQTPSYGSGAPPGATYLPPPPPPPPAAVYAPNIPPPARESSEEQAVANRAYGAELGMRREQDAADGYRATTVSRAIAGFKKMGGSGVIITGFYARSDRLGGLADASDDSAGERILVTPERLPHAGQALLIDCRNCQVTIWARKGCSKSVLGEEAGAACLVIERVKKGTYEANTPIIR
jgi:hypothetical protein